MLTQLVAWTGQKTIHTKGNHNDEERVLQDLCVPTFRLGKLSDMFVA